MVGGGLPVAAYGGSAHLMDQMAPDGPVYQAGTLSGNPLGMAAGLATLKKLKTLNPYEQLTGHATALADGFAQAAQKQMAPGDALFHNVF